LEEINQDELNNLAKNQEFLALLKAQEKQAIEQKDIIKLYQILDTYLVLCTKQDRINAIYKDILLISLEKVEDTLRDAKKIDISDEQNLQCMRAFYEHGVEHWSTDNYSMALEIMFMLSKICSDQKLNITFLLMFISLYKKETLEFFQDNYIDLEASIIENEYLYFPVNFIVNAKEYISENKEIIAKEFKRLERKLKLES